MGPLPRNWPHSLNPMVGRDSVGFFVAAALDEAGRCFLDLDLSSRVDVAELIDQQNVDAREALSKGPGRAASARLEPKARRRDPAPL